MDRKLTKKEYQENFKIKIVNKNWSKKYKPQEGKDNYVFVGRPSILGNPYPLSSYSRAESIRLYRMWLAASFLGWTKDSYSPRSGGYVQNLDNDIRNELKRLASLLLRHGRLYLECFCAPKPCHGEVIAKAIFHLIFSGEVFIRKSMLDRRIRNDINRYHVACVVDSDDMIDVKFNDDRDLFNDNHFGEGFDGMARHTSNMTQLERNISEHCYYNGNRLLDPRIVENDGRTLTTKPEYIMKKCGIDIYTAEKLTEYFLSLNFTAKMREQCIEEIRKDSEKAASMLLELSMIDLNLKEVTEQSKEEQLIRERQGEIETASDQDLERIFIEIEKEVESTKTGYSYVPIGDSSKVELPEFSEKYFSVIKQLRDSSYDELHSLTKKVFALPNYEKALFFKEYSRVKNDKLERVLKSNRLGELTKRLKAQKNIKDLNKAISYCIALDKGKKRLNGFNPSPTTRRILKQTFFETKEKILST